MSLRKEQKKCMVCGKMFEFNPDVGKWCCPHCGKAGGNKAVACTEVSSAGLSFLSEHSSKRKQ